MGKHFPKTHQLHKLFNRTNVKVSYSSLPNFKSVINGHNENILNEQEKTSPCNCRDKTSCPLNGSCQHKNLVLALQNIHLKIDSRNIIILSSTSQRETQQNFLISFGGKKKEKINVDLDWSILDKAKPYSPASKKCMLCLTEKYHIIFSTKNLLNKRNEMVTKCRHENKFYLANYKDIPP